MKPTGWYPALPHLPNDHVARIARADDQNTAAGFRPDERRHDPPEEARAAEETDEQERIDHDDRARIQRRPELHGRR